MSRRENTASGMRDAYLYQNNTVANRFVQHGGQVLRNGTVVKKTPTGPGEGQGQREEKDNESAVRKLDEELNAMTDPELLSDARQIQREMNNGHRSYA
ncbi:hypothetical protein A1O3_08806 [Capronia epimyces CBS 606.96]|uniref:Uncharacterized protein n=1 Tax=Capronia epimyces CBS 606.96 TaxID=1182542 RepID=W9YAA1_9EURO|nr:uncharacterized protein A1O3_08806 [Capronia epimyces CBS 606.96]EXJ79304.1 hypothetical protein A1O3_08806 [Capronia epimyces CBS 606.96]